MRNKCKAISKLKPFSILDLEKCQMIQRFYIIKHNSAAFIIKITFKTTQNKSECVKDFFTAIF